MKVAFIGLGNMGRPMCRNFLKAGFPLAVYNRTRGPEQALVETGASAAASPAEAAAQAEVICTCLTDPAAVTAVVAGERGVLDGVRPGALIIDFSTVDPGTTQRLAQAAKARGASYLDAPVSGGATGAEAGTLTIMVGGEREAFERARPVLQAVGKHLHYLGPSGMGNVAKLVNQLLTAVNQAAVAEAFALGMTAGADPKALYDILSTSWGASAMLHRSVPAHIITGQFESGSHLELMIKDLSLIQGLARSINAPVFLSAVAREMYTMARAQGLGRKDLSAVILPLRQT
ncbi:MAG: NAD(P)-dependent oxidoreductase [Armatimonadetes bacterium]|nr:NAD(P)-dependent oxidoreductase [Armatimonadota bacterium]